MPTEGPVMTTIIELGTLIASIEEEARQDIQSLDQQHRQLVDKLAQQIDKTAWALTGADTTKVLPKRLIYVHNVPKQHGVNPSNIDTWTLPGTGLTIGSRWNGLYDGLIQRRGKYGYFYETKDLVRIGGQRSSERYVSTMVALEQLYLQAIAHPRCTGIEG